MGRGGGGSIFADKSISHVHLLWLQFLVDFDRAGEYSWGSAALSWLYREMCRACEGSTSIGGALNLLQLWTFCRFPCLVPSLVSEPQIDYGVDVDRQPLPCGPYGVK